MYLRESKQKRRDGQVVTYLQIAENVWNPEKQRSQARIVYNCGRGDDPATVERLRRLARSILRRCSPEEIVTEGAEWSLVCAWPYGDVYVLETIWQRLGIDEVIRKQVAKRRFGFDMERALFALVANRACAPASKLYCHEQWLKEDVHIRGARTLELHQLYRAMDFLEANKEDIEQAIYFQLADLLNLDVEIVFYDTTSLHFEIDEEDEGDEDGLVKGSREAGNKAYPAPRKRGHSKNGRKDAPQIVVGLAVTRDGFPVRHWVFPGNTVDVTTVAKVKEDLKGWQLSRCLFVGDAGMVSQANLQSLSRGGGKYLLAMPMRRGDEVTEAVLGRPGRYREVADNLKVKEVVVGDGERRRRYAVCYNPLEARRQKQHRERLIEETRGRAGKPVGSKRGLQQACLCVAHQCAVRTTAERDEQGAGDRPQGGQGTGAVRWQVRCPQQRRHPNSGRYGAGLQATATGGRGVADDEERIEDAPGLPVGRHYLSEHRSHHKVRRPRATRSGDEVHRRGVMRRPWP